VNVADLELRRATHEGGGLRIYETRTFAYNGRVANERRVTLRRNARITLPVDVRERVHAEEGGVFIAEVTEDEDIVLRRRRLVDASQAYFWSDAWQKGEREAQADIRAGRTKKFRSAKDLIADIDR